MSDHALVAPDASIAFYREHAESVLAFFAQRTLDGERSDRGDVLATLCGVSALSRGAATDYHATAAVGYQATRSRSSHPCVRMIRAPEQGCLADLHEIEQVAASAGARYVARRSYRVHALLPLLFGTPAA